MFEIKISYDELLSRLGYLKTKTKIKQNLLNVIVEIINLANKLFAPKVAIAFSNDILINDVVFLNKKFKIKSDNIKQLLNNCFKVYGIFVTVGKALDDKIKDFGKRREFCAAAILDAAGSVAVEKVINIVNLKIKNYENKNGNILTRRYSPGYGDWKLESNKDFYNWVGAKKIGIILNDFYQMKPEKSISALIGVTKNYNTMD
ncbi:MAG: hypothetical protein LBL53_00340 [Endomicrobium sp.]|jgi:hypothetical protein|nr:hypothetical protein [Endomicrobium sp.]